MPEYSRTWWGQRFLQALEAFTDPTRLARGRTYANTGRVLEYHLERNVVSARVRGSLNPYFGVYTEPVYLTTITLEPISSADWTRSIASIAGRASMVSQLLLNEMPDAIEEVFTPLGLHLLPHSQGEFETFCSCPDWSNPCKHVAAVYYLLASDLDRDPFLLFELRGLTRQHLRHELRQSPLGTILASEMIEPEVPVESAASFHTRPRQAPAAALGYHDFWSGKRLPPPQPAPRAGVSGLAIKRQGDFPPFWRKSDSFLETMDELYERVRTKSRELK